MLLYYYAQKKEEEKMNQTVNKKIGNEEVAVMLLERMKREIEKTKERIVFRPVDRKVFGGRLNDIVSVDAGNGFSFIFAVCFEDCYMYINKELACSLDLDEEEIYEFSMVNTPRINTATFQDMATLMLKKTADDNKSPLLDEMKEVDKDSGLFVLTNKSNRNGAACLYYPGVQKRIAELLDSDYYVIPCSKHELIITSCDTDMTPEYIKHMVYEINRSEVEDSDVLSDTVLKYDRELKALVKV